MLTATWNYITNITDVNSLKRNSAQIPEDSCAPLRRVVEAGRWLSGSDAFPCGCDKAEPERALARCAPLVRDRESAVFRSPEDGLRCHMTVTRIMLTTHEISRGCSSSRNNNPSAVPQVPAGVHGSRGRPPELLLGLPVASLPHVATLLTQSRSAVPLVDFGTTRKPRGKTLSS